ncbi:MAG: GtrA family protein [bacterium]
MSNITVHTIIKNEENFVGYAIRSVIDFVEQVIVFDTGSTDDSVNVIKKLVAEYPDKIIFEEKGECDKLKHTQLRQEMLERTTTDWFMILDGDEVWTRAGMTEVLHLISKPELECLIAPFYLCFGDAYHAAKKENTYEFFGKLGLFSARVLRRTRGVHWSGEYGLDRLVDSDGQEFIRQPASNFLENKYWHLSHLQRSSVNLEIYSSGGSRNEKKRLTYFAIAKPIATPLPEVFDEAFLQNNTLSPKESLCNFKDLLMAKIWKTRHQFGKYFITGISALILDMLSLYLLKEFFGMRPVYAVIVNQALLLNYVFVINKYWSFGAKGMGKQQMFRFYVLAICNYLFSVVWMYAVNDGLGVNYLLARFVNIGLSVSWNFLIYKYWVYKIT